MSKIKEYILAKNEALKAYPNTTALTSLMFEHRDCFDTNFVMLWITSSQQAKVMTMENMILEWNEAPASLVASVEKARAERKIRGLV